MTFFATDRGHITNGAKSASTSLPLVLASVVLTLMVSSDVCLVQAQRGGAGGGILLDLKNPPAYSELRPDDKVEDALALGNSLRNGKRYADAERAYRLAAKLGPRDPRPHIGLANIYSDQRRFSEATAAYMRALELVKLRPSPTPRFRPRARQAPAPDIAAVSPAAGTKNHGALNGEWHAYLGSALLQQGDHGRAAFEFKKAILQDKANAQWHALLGYTLLAQKRFTDAAGPLKLATELDDSNVEYRNLQERLRDEQAKALANDTALTESLVGSRWQVPQRQQQLTCTLLAEGKVSCTQAAKYDLWRVEGGLLQLYSSAADSYCSGKASDQRLTLTCNETQMPTSQQPDGRYTSWTETWAKMR